MSQTPCQPTALNSKRTLLKSQTGTEVEKPVLMFLRANSIGKPFLPSPPIVHPSIALALFWKLPVCLRRSRAMTLRFGSWMRYIDDS